MMDYIYGVSQKTGIGYDQLTSAHAHRFCLEHKTIEEVSLGALSGRSIAGRVPSAEGALTEAAKNEPAQHVPCVFASSASIRFTAAPTQSSTTFFAALPNVAPSPDIAIGDAIAILAQAPKHSPPSSVCC